MAKTQNPGSAIGEAIGAKMEIALNEYLKEFVDDFHYHLVSKGPLNPKTKKHKKLLLYDNFGTAYNLDAVVTNEAMQPIILIEYKYIRYKKHNRDKGSWLCTAHNAVRKRYSSVRSSIAILAGNWSKSSQAMMKSHDVNLFMIPFDTICDLLREHNIEFDWGEKDRNTAVESWNTYQKLSEEEKLQIGREMINVIKDDLEEAIFKVLDDSIPREIEKVSIEIRTSIGEAKHFEFDAIDQAIQFLKNFGFEEIFDTSTSLTLFDKPEIDDI